MIDTATWLEERANDWQEISDCLSDDGATKLIESDKRELAELAEAYRLLAAALRALKVAVRTGPTCAERRGEHFEESPCDCCEYIYRARAVLTRADKLHEAHEKPDPLADRGSGGDAPS